MPLDLTSVADEVKDILNKEDWGDLEFEAVRVWVPRMDEETLKTLRVYVTGAAAKTERGARGVRNETDNIQICVAMKVEDTTPEFVDPLVSLTIAISKKFENAVLTETLASEMGIEVYPYDFEFLYYDRIYLGYVIISLEGGR